MEEEETGEGIGEVADAPPLTQSTVIETADPPQGRRDADAGAQAGDRNPGTSEGEGAEGMLPGSEILKGLFLGDACNGFNNLSKLSMPWTFRHRCPSGAHFALNCYMHSVQLLLFHPGDVDKKTLPRKEGVIQVDPLHGDLWDETIPSGRANMGRVPRITPAMVC